MNITKVFEDSFKHKCFLTNHALDRIKKRFKSSELNLLRFLIQSAMKSESIESWGHDESIAIVDARFNIGVVCAADKNRGNLTIITVIRGKEPGEYKKCRIVSASILKEKAEQEAQEIKELSKQSRMRI